MFRDTRRLPESDVRRRSAEQGGFVWMQKAFEMGHSWSHSDITRYCTSSLIVKVSRFSHVFTVCWLLLALNTCQHERCPDEGARGSPRMAGGWPIVHRLPQALANAHDIADWLGIGIAAWHYVIGPQITDGTLSMT